MTLYISMKVEGNYVFFLVKGRRFYWEQVRRIVCLLMSVGLGRISTDTFRKILRGEPYSGGIPPAPPEGLILWRIKTKIDDNFVEIEDRERIRERIVREVKKAILSAKWTFPRREK